MFYENTLSQKAIAKKIITALGVMMLGVQCWSKITGFRKIENCFYNSEGIKLSGTEKYSFTDTYPIRRTSGPMLN